MTKEEAKELNWQFYGKSDEDADTSTDLDDTSLDENDIELKTRGGRDLEVAKKGGNADYHDNSTSSGDISSSDGDNLKKDNEDEEDDDDEKVVLDFKRILKMGSLYWLITFCCVSVYIS